jgi:ATP-dependent RNA helicase MRH4
VFRKRRSPIKGSDIEDDSRSKPKTSTYKNYTRDSPSNGKQKEKSESNLPILTSFENKVLNKSINLISKITTFAELKITPVIRDLVVKQLAKQTVLLSQNFENYKDIEAIDIKPSKIQTIAIHEISKNLMDKNLQIFTIAAETGSGKTWAYLTPMLDFLKQQEQQVEWENVKKRAAIRSVILLPTQELVDQVYSNVKELEQEIGIKPFKWNFETTHNEFVDAFKSRIDILVTTPGKLNTIKRIRMLDNAQHVLSSVKFLVIDEADTLMDRSFIEDTYEAMNSMFNVQRVVLCSATISNQLSLAINKIFPSITEPKLLISPTLHKSPKSIKFHLINSEIQPYQGSKLKALAQTLYAIHSDGTEKNYEKRCIVFVNGKVDVEPLVEKLRANYNHDVVGLTGNDKPEDRSSKISLFVNPPRLLSEIEVNTKNNEDEYEMVKDSNIKIKKNFDSKKGADSGDPRKLKILVTTDIAARGLNFFAVRNVVLYDTPSTPTDLIHRVGRTGRMNQSGRVFIITDRKTRSWVKNFAKGKE